MTAFKRGLLRLCAVLAVALLLWWLATGAQVAFAAALTPWLVGAGVLYLAAHVLRGLRLLLLIYDGRVRFREVLRAHLFAAGVSRLVPFKLGEFYRIALVDCLVANPATAIATVLIERAYDVAFLALLLASGLLLCQVDHPAAKAALVLASSVLAAAALTLVALPELLPLLKRYLVLRHNSERSLVLLRAVDRIDLLLAGAVGRWRQRRAAVTALSAMIWAIEAGVLVIVVRSCGSSSVIDGMVDALIELVLQGSLGGGTGAASAALPAYLLITAVPLSLLALLLAVISPFRRHPHPPIAVILDRRTNP